MLCGMVVVAWLAVAQPCSAKGAPAASQAADAAPVVKFLTDSVPKWVAPVSPAPTASVPHAAAHYALRDFQTKVGRDGVERFVHIVRVLNESAGLDSGAQIEIEFDPSFQKLVFHQISVLRGNRRIDKLEVKRVKFLQRETQLEKRIYDGRMTASIVLDDVRVGDRIEVAYSLRGENPVFKGKLVEHYWSVATIGPTALFQYRLVAPAQRAIQVHARGAEYKQTEQTKDGMREVVVRRTSVPQPQLDQSAPASAYFDDQVQISEFANWQEVAAWADELFAVSRDKSAEVSARALEIAQASSSPEDRVRRALDFVQKDIRYFGTEIGVNTHQPASPETVLKQRFGDCKDKVVLLVALLRELGIEASPALVSTDYRGDVADHQPSPLAFNHVIARVVLNDKVLWLDGTRGYQTGALAGRVSTGFDKGLVARAGESNLAVLPSALTDVHVVANDTIRFAMFSEDPILETHISYYGEYAEVLRAMLAAAPATELQKAVVNEYARLYGSVDPLGSIQVDEIAQENGVTLTMRFRLRDYLLMKQRQLGGNLVLVSMVDPLRVPNQAPRTQPFRVPNPGIFRQTVTVEFPEEIFTKPISDRFDERNPQFELHAKLEGAADRMRVDGELRITSTTIPAAEWQTYMQRVQKAFPHLASSVTVPTVSPKQLDQLKRDLTALEADYQRGKYGKPTAVRARALGEVVLQDAQIAGGRLPPKLRAQVLIERATNLDHLGRAESAAIDFEEAIRIDPRNADAHAGLAVNALLRRQDDLAHREASTALMLAPNDIGPRYTRAYAKFYGQDYGQARDELIEILKDRSELERSYGSIWLYIATRRNGQDGAEAVKQFMPSASRPEWPYPVLQWLTNAIDFDQALAATKDNERADEGRRCELYFYAAQKYLLDGNQAKAREYFQKSVDTGVIEFTEFMFSRRELERMTNH